MAEKDALAYRDGAASAAMSLGFALRTVSSASPYTKTTAFEKGREISLEFLPAFCYVVNRNSPFSETHPVPTLNVGRVSTHE